MDSEKDPDMGAWDAKLRSPSTATPVKSFFAELSTSDQSAHERAADATAEILASSCAPHERGA